MAVGDAAAAAGMQVVPGTAAVRDTHTEVNRTRDYLAEHQTNGGHPWSKITGKPATFPPSAHNHSANTIGTSALGFPTNVDAAIGELAARIAGQTSAIAAKRDVGDGNFGSTPIYSPHARSNQVTTSYVACYVNSDGRLGASPSSRRYKDNITDADLDPAAVLALRPREFDRIGGGHELGLIAEEVDEHLPALVVRAVTEDGGDRIDGVHYHLLPVALLAVARHQADQIAALRRELDELRGDA